jgi:carboxyl-terminal processing protease
MKNIFSKRTSFFTILLLMMLIGPYGDRQVSAIDRGTYKSLRTFNEILDMVGKNYVEPVSSDKLIEGAINGMIKSLDPHSTYMTQEMYKELEVETRGSFGGVGIEITLVKDVLTVVSPIEDTPAYKAGVKAADQIIKIDGNSTKDITIMEAVKKLRGAKGTRVTITIVREGLSKPIDIEITRDIIVVKSVKSKIYNGNTGYLRIASFQEHTGDDLEKALKEINPKDKPLAGIIIDMRNNPGGLLNQSIEVSDLFLKKGVIVSTRGRSKNMESKSVARDDGNEPLCPIIILVNEGTASASEIVSGALQDNKRAVIMGTQTFGKGSVQTVIPLEDGSALKLTTAKYYTPNGRSIQAEGITPDIIVKQAPRVEEANGEKDADKNHIMREKDLKGHIKSTTEKNGKEEKMKAEDTLEKDNQLKSAIDLMKGLIILTEKK